MKPWLREKTSLRMKEVPGVSGNLLGNAGVLNALGSFISFLEPLTFRGAGLTHFEGNQSLTW